MQTLLLNPETPLPVYLKLLELTPKGEEVWDVSCPSFEPTRPQEFVALAAARQFLRGVDGRNSVNLPVGLVYHVLLETDPKSASDVEVLFSTIYLPLRRRSVRQIISSTLIAQEMVTRLLLLCALKPHELDSQTAYKLPMSTQNALLDWFRNDRTRKSVL